MSKELTPMEKRVFGVDAKRDASGRPVEQGLGSKTQPTHAHAKAWLKTLREQEAPAEEIAKAERFEQQMRGTGEDPTMVA